jgi:cbb3-type cytochrome oxidase subunit 3
MRTMSDAAATIFTAIAGGLFALAVAYIGYRAGQRQTTDQATVEHGQWLRGQRQQAYLAFVDTWDTTVDTLQRLQQSWESRVCEYQQGDRLDDPTEEPRRLLEEARRAVLRDLERVELLGPSADRRCGTGAGGRLSGDEGRDGNSNGNRRDLPALG